MQGQGQTEWEALSDLSLRLVFSVLTFGTPLQVLVVVIEGVYKVVYVCLGIGLILIRRC
jgi:hypothetical protein